MSVTKTGRKRQRNRVEFRHRGRNYGVFFPGGGSAHYLKRQDRINGKWVWRIMDKPSENLWNVADAALDKAGVVL